MNTNCVRFIDTTLRDGNQSLWGATGLRTGMMLQIAPVLDRVGYHALDFSTSTHMAVTVRFHKAVSRPKCNTEVNEPKLMAYESWPASVRRPRVACASHAWRVACC